MAWVRYDDQFHNNAKVTAVVMDDAGAIGLHALANTWTNGTKHPGFVPAHQPGALICDRNRGAEWAEILVKHGLWHRLDNLCPECKEEYADLPEGLDGFVFHNAQEFRAPGRYRTVPGTPADLSEKRRAAGRKGGKASARKRAADKQQHERQAVAAQTGDEQPPAESKQNARANEANSASKPSNELAADVAETATDNPPLTLVTDEEAPPKPKRRKTKRKANRTVQDDQADELTNAFWERYSKGSAQSWISIQKIILGALNNDPTQRDNVARALDAIGRQQQPVTQNILTMALRDVRNRQGLRPTGTYGPHQPYRNPEDQSEYDEDMF